MRRSIYKRNRYYGKGAKDLIRPTLNQGRVFVGEGLLKKRYKKKSGRRGSLKKVAKNPILKDIARTGAKYLSGLYQGGVNKIKK